MAHTLATAMFRPVVADADHGHGRRLWTAEEKDFCPDWASLEVERDDLPGMSADCDLFGEPELSQNDYNISDMEIQDYQEVTLFEPAAIRAFRIPTPETVQPRGLNVPSSSLIDGEQDEWQLQVSNNLGLDMPPWFSPPLPSIIESPTPNMSHRTHSISRFIELPEDPLDASPPLTSPFISSFDTALSCRYNVDEIDGWCLHDALHTPAVLEPDGSSDIVPDYLAMGWGRI